MIIKHCIKVISFLLLTIPIVDTINAQGGFAINITGANANASSMLDVSSTSRGVLLPRVALTAANVAGPIAGPATSLIVYNTATAGSSPNNVTPGFYYWDGSKWLRLATANEAWLLTGNSGTAVPANYIGTNDNTSFRIVTNNLPAMYFNSTSNFIGIGDENPQDNLVIRLNSRAVSPSSSNYSGIQIKSPTAGSASNLGLHIGLDNFISTEARIMNYGNGDMWFGVNDNEVLRIKNSSRFIGIGESNPQDNLVIRLNPAATNGGPEQFSGISIHSPVSFTGGNDVGLHIGLDNTLAAEARILNHNNADLWLGTGGNQILTLKPSSRNMGVNISTPFHALSVQIGTGGAYSTPYDGLHVTTFNNPLIQNTGLVVGSDPSGAFQNKGIWNYDNGRIAFGTNNIERMNIDAGGNVGIGVTPGNAGNSTLQVDGTIAVGVTMNLSGGTIGSPLIITNQKSYIGVSPTGATDSYFELPNPTTCTGRIYYIRNNSNSVSAWVRTTTGLLCPGSTVCLGAGTYYELKGATSVKTVICISDGVNWTIGKID